MVERAAPQTHYRLRLRIPGWLLAAVLLAPALFFGAKVASGAFDRASPDLGMPVRVQLADATIESNGVSLRVVIESNRPFDPRELRYHLLVERDGNTERLPAGASILGDGPWAGRSVVVQVDRVLPDGMVFRELAIDGPGWGAGIGPGHPAEPPEASAP